MYVRALLLALAGHQGTWRNPDTAVQNEYLKASIRRVVLAVVAAIACLAGCAVLWVAGLVALWYTPWLVTYLVVSGLVLLIASVLAALGAMARTRDARALRNAGAAHEPDPDVFPRSAAMRFAVAALPAITTLWVRGRLARGVARQR